MAVQAQTVDVPQASGLSRRDLLGTLVILALGTGLIILAGLSTQAGDRSVFTDQMLGTLFSLPSQATLYTIGGICYFLAGMRLFRRLSSLRSVLTWSVARPSSGGYFVRLASAVRK